jgi:hypothetical protein
MNWFAEFEEDVIAGRIIPKTDQQHKLEDSLATTPVASLG